MTTLEDTLRECFKFDEISDIAEYGWFTGQNKFTNLDTKELYYRHKDEIEDIIWIYEHCTNDLLIKRANSTDEVVLLMVACACELLSEKMTEHGDLMLALA